MDRWVFIPSCLCLPSYRTLWTTNAAGEPYEWYSDVSHCDLVLVMGTSLSGLTIDSIAHSVGSLGKPRIVFDLSDAPVRSIQSEGPWVEAKDCFLQGAIDASILEMMYRLGWIQ